MTNGVIANTWRVGKYIVSFVTGRSGSMRKAMFSTIEILEQSLRDREKSSKLARKKGTFFAFVALFCRLRD
jgi:hypothetical protein